MKSSSFHLQISSSAITCKHQSSDFFFHLPCFLQISNSNKDGWRRSSSLLIFCFFSVFFSSERGNHQNKWFLLTSSPNGSNKNTIWMLHSKKIRFVQMQVTREQCVLLQQLTRERLYPVLLTASVFQSSPQTGCLFFVFSFCKSRRVFFPVFVTTTVFWCCLHIGKTFSVVCFLLLLRVGFCSCFTHHHWVLELFPFCCFSTVFFLSVAFWAAFRFVSSVVNVPATVAERSKVQKYPGVQKSARKRKTKLWDTHKLLRFTVTPLNYECRLFYDPHNSKKTQAFSISKKQSRLHNWKPRTNQWKNRLQTLSDIFRFFLKSVKILPAPQNNFAFASCWPRKTHIAAFKHSSFWWNRPKNDSV